MLFIAVLSLPTYEIVKPMEVKPKAIRECIVKSPNKPLFDLKEELEEMVEIKIEGLP